MKSLRRRDQLVQLDSPATKEDFTLYGEQQEESGIFLESSPTDASGHYVSPCEFRVSNDPLVVQEDPQDCDATIYGCARDHTFLITTKEDVKEVDLRYNYDLYYEFDSSVTNLQDIVEFLEGTMLEHLASILEIKQCPPGGGGSDSNNAAAAKRGPQKNRRRWLFIPTTDDVQKKGISGGRNLMEEFTDEQKSVFIAINSDPRDVPADEEYDCIMPPEEGIQCQSMNGFMKLYLEDARVSEEDTVEISVAVLKALEGGMKGNVYTKGAIKSLVFREATQPIVVPSEYTTTTTITTTTIPSEDDPSPPPPPPQVPVAALPSAIDSNTSINGDSSPLGETAIGVIVGASSFVLLLSILTLFMFARRQKIESTSTTTTTANNNNNNNKEMQTDEGSSMRSISMRSRSSQRRTKSPQTNRRNSYKQIAPSLEPQRSLEGAEIPGSLAAMDALALKPQVQRTDPGDDDHFFSVEDCGSMPLTPPRISPRRRAVSAQKRITTTTISPRDGVEKSRSPLDVPPDAEAEEDASTDDETAPRPVPPPNFMAAGSLSPVPLSPVRNSRSGVSPSRVSPKRLPSPFNEPFVIRRRNCDEESPMLYSPSPLHTTTRRSKSYKMPSVEVLRGGDDNEDQSGVATKGSITTLGLILDGSMSSDTHSDLITAKGGRGRTLLRSTLDL